MQFTKRYVVRGGGARVGLVVGWWDGRMLGWSVAALLYTPSIVRAPKELVMLPALQNDVAVSAAVIAALLHTRHTNIALGCC